MIDVTCAIIRNEENDVLVVQRGAESDHPLKWEFPGGKTRKGESDEECIIREISEELSMDIVICSRLNPVEHDYGTKQIRLIPFTCDSLDELPILTEHVGFRWVKPEELSEIDFCEADVFVAEQYLSVSGTDKTDKENVPSPQLQSAIDDRDLQDMINSMMSMQEAEWVAASALENPAVFNKLFEYSCSGDSKLAFRASWTLTKVGDKYPEIFDPYLHQLVEILPKVDNEGVERCFLRIISLSSMEKIDEKHHGLLADYCFTALGSAESAIAIKVYSMEVLYNLSVIYPQLANELAVSVRLLMEDGSAAIVSRGNSVLKKITMIPLNPRSSQK
jgi:8-oxo-dGTP diphosphatase